MGAAILVDVSNKSNTGAGNTIPNRNGKSQFKMKNRRRYREYVP